MHLRLAVVTLACSGLLLGSAACDLPQNSQEESSSTTDDPDDSNTDNTLIGGERSFKMLRLTDQSSDSEASMPGADIDAVVVFRDGTFISAGCYQATLFGAETGEGEGSGNGNLDPSRATLPVREQSEGSGFVSLSGGALFCELPVAVRTGDQIEIWEVEGDKQDGWKAALAESVDGEYTDVGDWVSGSAVIDVP